MRFILLAAFLIMGCNEDKVYECSAWEKRACLCPSGEEGTQKCSRGPAFADPPPPRVWKKCSCCFDIHKDEHGIYYINKKIESGCWDDVYNPSDWHLDDVGGGDR